MCVEGNLIRKEKVADSTCPDRCGRGVSKRVGVGGWGGGEGAEEGGIGSDIFQWPSSFSRAHILILGDWTGASLQQEKMS